MTAVMDPQPVTFMSEFTSDHIVDAQDAINDAISSSVTFDPKEHIDYETPSSVSTMEDLGFPQDLGISRTAVTQPFRLFSKPCIQKFREEVLQDVVMKDYSVGTNIAACHLRGYALKHAPFVYDAWHNPEVLKIVSQLAGVDLIPCMDLEIGHINISVKSESHVKTELAELQARQGQDDDSKPVVGWHKDSYPFVCVVMLSDCTEMVGGETAIRTGFGDTIRIKSPEMGCAVVLQGRYLAHQALQTAGIQERITMVTSFRPRSPFLRDDSNLSTVRAISDLSELYYNFGKYRLEILEERIRAELKRLQKARSIGRKTDTVALKNFLNESERFLRKTNEEIVLDADVKRGHQPVLVVEDRKGLLA